MIKSLEYLGTFLDGDNWSAERWEKLICIYILRLTSLTYTTTYAKYDSLSYFYMTDEIDKL